MVDLHLITVSAAGDDAQEKVLGLRGGAEVDLRRQDPQNGPGPGIAPLPVGDHLTLVDHSHLVGLFQVQLFCGGGHVGVSRPAVLLLTGGEAAVDAGIQQNLLGFQGQQAQRGQIHPGAGLLKALKPGVGFAGVGAAQVKNEVAVHGPGLRVLVLGVQGHEDL